MNETGHFDRLAEARYRKILDQQARFVWRRFDDGEELGVRIFFPEGHDKKRLAPSVVFFHGGMWQSRNEVEFVPWALQLAQHGIVTVLPDYRTRQSFEVNSVEILDEAREAWLWIHENALELGLSQRAITLAGSDAGGLMALHASIAPRKVTWKRLRRTVQTEPQPAAVALFRGVTGTEGPEAKKLFSGCDPAVMRDLNPANRLRKGLPPLFASHGDQDKLLPWRSGEQIAKLWKKKGNPSCFIRLENADHAYYHFNVNAAQFEYVLAEWMDFMTAQDIWQIEASSNGFLLV